MTERSRLKGLNRSSVRSTPIMQFMEWMEDVAHLEEPERVPMTLATVSKSGEPSARIVLLKQVDDRGFVFYTNYHSPKAEDLKQNPRGALVFHWPRQGRQVRVSGEVHKTSRRESEIYFHSRPLGSRLSAWASRQSESLGNRGDLHATMKKMVEKYGDCPPCPPFWGGYRLVPEVVEFWQCRENRLHDRIRYIQEEKGWRIERLNP